MLLALGACGLNHCISLKLGLEPPGGLGPTPPPPVSDSDRVWDEPENVHFY